MHRPLKRFDSSKSQCITRPDPQNFLRNQRRVASGLFERRLLYMRLRLLSLAESARITLLYCERSRAVRYLLKMLRLSSVHPAPPKALRRKVKGKMPLAMMHTEDELRGASSTATGCEHDEYDGKASTVEAPTNENKSAKENKSVNAQEETSDGDDDDDDSDYNFEADCGDEAAECSDDLLEDSEEEDRDEYRRALESELDDCADEGPDFYLQRMLAKRAQLDGDDAAWVDRYITLQQAWKERHNYSIDAFDLDVTLQSPAKKLTFATTKKSLMAKKKKVVRRAGGVSGARKKKKKAARTLYARQLRAFWRFWYLRVFPNLPPSLKQEPAEYVLALFAVMTFIALALSIQIYAAFRSVPRVP